MIIVIIIIIGVTIVVIVVTMINVMIVIGVVALGFYVNYFVQPPLRVALVHGLFKHLYFPVVFHVNRLLEFINN